MFEGFVNVGYGIVIIFFYMCMFEMVLDFVCFNIDFEVCVGYLLFVSDVYKKVGFVLGCYWVEMCLCVIESLLWLMVDFFEMVNCNEKGELEYVFIVKVLWYFDYEINMVLGGIEGIDGKMYKVKIVFLVGVDLVMFMGEFGFWLLIDLGVIFG